MIKLLRGVFACALVGSLAITIHARQAAADYTRNQGADIAACETQLAGTMTVHISIADTDQYTADCEGGGLGNSASIEVHIPKSKFVAIGKLGNADEWAIEGVELDTRGSSGGPNFSQGYDAAEAWGKVSCSHGPFGGGVTGKIVVIAKLHDLMSDRRATSIGRMCAASVFSPGVPR